MACCFTEFSVAGTNPDKTFKIRLGGEEALKRVCAPLDIGKSPMV